MSRLAGTSSGLSGGGVAVSLSARIAEAVATLGYLPPALLGALQIRFFDLMDHHRKSVAKHAGQTWPAKARARKFIFAYSSRYGSLKREPTELADLVGESFLFSPRGASGGGGGTFWEAYERGGTISAGKGMLIPFEAGAGPLGASNLLRTRLVKSFARAGLDAGGVGGYLGGGRFDIINTPRVKGLLIAELERRGSAGVRSIALGVIRKTRRQRPILRFHQTFDAIWPAHSAKFDKAVDQAMTVAGQQALAERTREAAAEAAARNQHTIASSPRRTEYDRNLRQYLLRTGRRTVATAIDKAVRDRAAALASAERISVKEAA